MARIKPRRGTTAPSTGLLQNELAVDTTNKRIYIGNAGGSGDLIGSAPGGSTTEVQFNDGGNLGGDAGLTYNKTTDTLGVDNIESIAGQLNVANIGSSRVAIGDYAINNNNTSIFIRDAISILDITNPYGDIRIGDMNALDSGFYISYNAAAAYLDGGGSALTNWSSGSFNSLSLAGQGELRFYDSDSSNYVGFESPATVAANKIWILPSADGTSGQVLSTNGSGTLSWSTASGGATGLEQTFLFMGA